LLFFVLCTLCCQFLWITLFWYVKTHNRTTQKATNQRRIDNTMDKWKMTKGETMIYNRLHRKLKIEQKRRSVRLYLQLFVGGRMSYLRYWCLFVNSGDQHILCCVFVFYPEPEARQRSSNTNSTKYLGVNSCVLDR
jgi:hypothetical protein